jgi:hypothetical protein
MFKVARESCKPDPQGPAFGEEEAEAKISPASFSREADEISSRQILTS